MAPSMIKLSYMIFLPELVSFTSLPSTVMSNRLVERPAKN